MGIGIIIALLILLLFSLLVLAKVLEHRENLRECAICGAKLPYQQLVDMRPVLFNGWLCNSCYQNYTMGFIEAPPDIEKQIVHLRHQTDEWEKRVSYHYFR
jgi:hypothetical protein